MVPCLSDESSAPFFQSGTDNNYQSAYGEFFLNWFVLSCLWGSFIHPADRLLLFEWIPNHVIMQPC
jgi:hypothetical protein